MTNKQKILDEKVRLIIAQSAPISFLCLWKDADFDYLTEHVLSLIEDLEKQNLMERAAIESNYMQREMVLKADHMTEIEEAEKRVLDKLIKFEKDTGECFLYRHDSLDSLSHPIQGKEDYSWCDDHDKNDLCYFNEQKDTKKCMCICHQAPGLSDVTGMQQSCSHCKPYRATPRNGQDTKECKCHCHMEWHYLNMSEEHACETQECSHCKD